MARLDEKEMKVFGLLKKLRTGKLTVVKYGGEIKHIETQINEIVAAKELEESSTATSLIRTKEIKI